MQRISIRSLSLRRFQLSDYDSSATLKHFNEENFPYRELCRCDDKKFVSREQMGRKTSKYRNVNNTEEDKNVLITLISERLRFDAFTAQ
jgi:hypothetical protein